MWWTALYCKSAIHILFHPQILTSLVDPLQAFHITTILFAAVGAFSTYILARCCFGTSSWAALVGSAAFLFNGFFTFRMAIGHVTYHGFGLVPLMALLALVPAGVNGDRLRLACRMAAFGLCVAYLVYGGALNFVVPAILAIMLLGLLHQLIFGWSFHFWLIISSGSILGAGISMLKLAPAFVFLSKFSRNEIPLALFNSLLRLLAQMASSFFLWDPTLITDAWLGHGRRSVGRHELEFGVSVVIGALILSAMLILAKQFWRQHRRAAMPTRGQIGILIMMGSILTIPVALSVGDEGWSALLKTLPYIITPS